MNYVMIYWSRFGHNKQIVEYLDEKLTDNGHKVKIFSTDKADPTSLPDADLYVFSASAEAFRVQRNMRIFMKKITGLEKKKYAIINTHGMKRKNWLKSMQRILSKKDMIKVAEIDFRIGEGQEEGKGFNANWKEKLTGFIQKISDL